MFHCMQTVSPFLYSCQDWYMSQIRSNACKQSTEFCSVVKTGICRKSLQLYDLGDRIRQMKQSIPMLTHQRSTEFYRKYLQNGRKWPGLAQVTL